ncbi:hypothetical protein GCM10028858_16630 [Halorubrum pallidum]
MPGTLDAESVPANSAPTAPAPTPLASSRTLTTSADRVRVRMRYRASDAAASAVDTALTEAAFRGWRSDGSGLFGAEKLARCTTDSWFTNQ